MNAASFAPGSSGPPGLEKLPLVSCRKLLDREPARIRRVSPSSQPAFYAVKDVLCLGQLSQALLPLDGAGHPAGLLEESWSYGIDDFPAITRKSLALGPSDGHLVLEEAAPLCFIYTCNFWHWLFEGLARVAVLESLGFRGQYIIPPDSHALETMLLLRIPRDRLLVGLRPFFIKRLLVSAHLPPDKFSPGTLAALHSLRSRLLAHLPRAAGSKRCYIRRLGKRKVSNEKELIAMLEPMGFEIMTPEAQPHAPAELLYMSNAECSVMPHGANCALAFAQPRDAHFFELFGMAYVNNCNGPMVKTAGLHYHQLVEKTGDLSAAAAEADFAVDVDFLRYCLRRALQG
ncbi:glycosyltransferase family 61 protein [Desulfovibrio sp. OttesenSCG-928-G11]|nr:glycosyltransferase family 61 protein [Desulfovibrio sp. OttesenSCG-928-G11]